MQHTDLLAWGDGMHREFSGSAEAAGRGICCRFPSGRVGKAALCPRCLAWSESSRRVSSPFPHFLYVTVGRGKTRRGNHKWSGLPSLSKQQNGLQVQPVCLLKNLVHCCLPLSWGNITSCIFAGPHMPPSPALSPLLFPPPSRVEADLFCLLVVPSY